MAVLSACAASHTAPPTASEVRLEGKVAVVGDCALGSALSEVGFDVDNVSGVEGSIFHAANNDYAVWQDFACHAPGVWVRDFRAGTTTFVVTAENTYGYQLLSAPSALAFVALGSVQIIDLETGARTTVAANPGSYNGDAPAREELDADPSGYGRYLVWQDLTTDMGDIYAYDRVRQEKISVYAGAGMQAVPKVLGSVVIWRDASRLVMKDLDTGATTTMSDGAGYVEIQSLKNDWVVFARAVVDGKNLYAYRLSTRETFLLSDEPGYPNAVTDGQSVVWNKNNALSLEALPPNGAITILSESGFAQSMSDGVVVWTDSRGDDYDIYSYSIAQGTTQILANEPGNETVPVATGGRIFWTTPAGTILVSNATQDREVLDGGGLPISDVVQHAAAYGAIVVANASDDNALALYDAADAAATSILGLRGLGSQLSATNHKSLDIAMRPLDLNGSEVHPTADGERHPIFQDWSPETGTPWSVMERQVLVYSPENSGPQNWQELARLDGVEGAVLVEFQSEHGAKVLLDSVSDTVTDLELIAREVGYLAHSPL